MRSAGDKPITEQPEQLSSARILCITASGDEPSQYMALMNSIFAAQARPAAAASALCLCPHRALTRLSTAWQLLHQWVAVQHQVQN